MSTETWEGPPSGTIIAGRYRLVKQLGAGGMGQVFLVQHVHTDERLALKALLDTVIKDENALERFRREARTPARIDSDHVVRVTDADVAPELKNAPFLVMEYLKGEDLENYLNRVGPLPPRDVVNFLRQIARVLDKAHGLGIVHRDLKPENIFITQREDGSAFLKILDFGIAKFTGEAANDLVHKTATSPGEIFGTPMFMSPEQAKSEAISPQTDIWALGLIAHKMLTNDEYWTAQTLTALIAQIVYEPMKTPTQKGYKLGAKYDEWLLQCCSREPAERFASAGAAVRALAAAFDLDANVTVPDAAPSIRTDAMAARGVTMTSSAEKSLSKTELQLATTGVATPRPETRGGATKLLVALGALLAAGAAIVFFLNRSGDDGTARAGTSEVAAATTPAKDPSGGNTPIPTPTTKVELGGTASPATTTSAVASAAPSASVSAVASADPAKTTKVGVGPKPPTTAPTGPATSPPAPSTKPNPPATTSGGGDELNSRY